MKDLLNQKIINYSQPLLKIQTQPGCVRANGIDFKQNWTWPFVFHHLLCSTDSCPSPRQADSPNFTPCLTKLSINLATFTESWTITLCFLSLLRLSQLIKSCFPNDQEDIWQWQAFVLQRSSCLNSVNYHLSLTTPVSPFKQTQMQTTNLKFKNRIL